VLTLGLRDGTEVSERVTHNRGGPDRPLSPEELAAKFHLNASRRIPVEQADALETAIRSLDGMASIAEVLEHTY